MPKLPQLKPLLQTAFDWVDERLSVRWVIDFIAHKDVPQHRHTSWYYWGGICLFLFLVQVVSGLLLMVYYRPGPDSYDSVRHITNEVQFGWLIRSVHSWAANLMLAAVFVHMFSVFFMRAYRKPREFGWWTGLGLMGLAMVFGFSGYLLPMDELSISATRVGLSLPELMPGMAHILTVVVRGGADVNVATVQRFFVLHVMLLPAVFLPLLGCHLLLIQKHGNAVPPSEEAKPAEERRAVPFVPHFLMRDIAVWLVVFTVLVALAALSPQLLGPQGDPLAPAPPGIHPEWYFMNQFALLKLVGLVLPGTAGEILCMGLIGLCMVVWGLIPLFDPRGSGPARARGITWLGLAALIGSIVLTVLGYRLA